MNIITKIESDESMIHLDIQTPFADALSEVGNLEEGVGRVNAVRSLINSQRDLIRISNKGKGAGAATVQFLSEMVDTLIHAMWDRIEIEARPNDKMVALVAVGGYGRRELCPKSDIDLLIITSENPDTREREQAEILVRTLWDYGFDVGSQVSSVSQCDNLTKQNPEIYTSFMKERFIGGNLSLYRNFLKMLRKPVSARRKKQMLQYKLEERKKRFMKYGALIQTLEPNLKEGPGCLRDVHTIMWIAGLLYGCRNFDDLMREGLISPQELEDIRTGYHFLLQVRCCLHFITNKKNDRLSFHLQPEVAAEFGFKQVADQKPVEVFLKYIYKHTKAINRTTQTFISRWLNLSEKGVDTKKIANHPYFKHGKNILELQATVGNPFYNNIGLMLDYFDLANQASLAYSNHALLRLRQATKVMDTRKLNPAGHITSFLKLCQRPSRVGRMLRTMHDVGLLALIIPDINRVYCHVQHNIYHIYTTDEHTLTVVRQLAYLGGSQGELLKPIRYALEHVKDRNVLILACFFHDIGKGQQGDHSITGAKLLMEYMKSAGFSEEQCQEGALVVSVHLLMNDLAQRRNIDDPNIISGFISKLGSVSVLHMLYVLTYCDISSVHPDAWTGWKAILLNNLYKKALEAFNQPLPQRVYREALIKDLIGILSKNVSKIKAKNHLHTMPRQYLSSFNSEEMLCHLQMIDELKKKKSSIKLKNMGTHYALTFAAADRSGLLAWLTGRLAVSGLSILNARIFTRMDGVVLDEFYLSPAANNYLSFDDISNKLNSQLVLPDMRGNKKLDISIPDKKPLSQIKATNSTLHVPVGVTFSNDISEDFSTVDISCRDQVGLMYLVARIFHEMDINIHNAVLTTEADVAMDAFYITNLYNNKITDLKNINLLIDRLKKVLIDGNW